ncbi:MAG TPA: hypothetical protein VLF21_03785 [Candidatus Saccharimonadales bacterium]|nr:hypothetical protein [Candidatus Saccharimonadales bacterium]
MFAHPDSGVGTFLIHPGEEWREERTTLIRHLREAHANLFGAGPGVGMGGGSPLPESGVSDLPLPYLVAIHKAAHLGLETDHDVIDWLHQPKSSTASTEQQ